MQAGGLQAQGIGGMMPMQAQGFGGMMPMQAQGFGGLMPMQAQGFGGIMPMQAQGAMMPIGGLPLSPMQVQNPMIGGFGQMQGISPYGGLSPAIPIPYMRPPIVGPFGLLYDETETA